ncbi:MAG TPA: radical SAM protein [Firmicutes bacterium]|nr:radical SAM protein [Bacillota bacterium]
MTEEAMPLVCSYGCRFHCIFCGADHHNFRFLKPESFVDRIEMVQKKYGTKYIAIRDSFWPPSHDWLEGFFNEIERRNLKFEFQFLSKAGALNERQLRKLFEIGARVTMYGVEAGDPAILKTVKKGITIDMARKNGRLLHDAGIYAVTFFIFGFKGENRQTIQASINLAAELNPGVSYFTPLAPLPGTEVYDQTPESDRDWWMREGTRPSLCELSPEELDRLSKEAFIRYPLRWSYLKQNVFFGNLPHEYRRIAWRFFTVQLRKYIPGILERYAFFRLIIHGIKSAMKRG